MLNFKIKTATYIAKQRSLVTYRQNTENGKYWRHQTTGA